MKKPDSELIVSIPQARFLLAEKGETMSDEQIRELILRLDELAILVIDMYKVQKSNQLS